MRSLDVEMLLGADVTNIDQLKAKMLELAEKKRQRWIEDRRILEIIANTPLSRQTLECRPRPYEVQVRIQVPNEINGTPQFDRRCCVWAGSGYQELAGCNEQLFWGFTRQGDWLLVTVEFDYLQYKNERKLEILRLSGEVGASTLKTIAGKAVRHPLQILRGMECMVAQYQQRMKRIVFDLDEELEAISYEARVAEDRADALGWDNKVHGAQR